eukprot:1422378-Rhodomonas_salina.1
MSCDVRYYRNIWSAMCGTDMSCGGCAGEVKDAKNEFYFITTTGVASYVMLLRNQDCVLRSNQYCTVCSSEVGTVCPYAISTVYAMSSARCSVILYAPTQSVQLVRY